jgi:hypothetical protein
MSNAVGDARDDLHSSTKEDPLLAAKEEADRVMFYRASFLASNHLDGFSFRFLDGREMLKSMSVAHPLVTGADRKG